MLYRFFPRVPRKTSLIISRTNLASPNCQVTRYAIPSAMSTLRTYKKSHSAIRRSGTIEVHQDKFSNSTEKKNAPRECIRNDHLNSLHFDPSNVNSVTMIYRVFVKESNSMESYFHFVADVTATFNNTFPVTWNIFIVFVTRDRSKREE